MSIIVTLQVNGDPNAVTQWAQDNPSKMQDILTAAKHHGLIAHRFFSAEDGKSLMVCDEWPDRQSFETFLQEQEPAIRPIFEAAHAQDRPQPTYWQQMDTGDAYGWGA